MTGWMVYFMLDIIFVNFGFGCFKLNIIWKGVGVLILLICVSFVWCVFRLESLVNRLIMVLVFSGVLLWKVNLGCR